MRNNAGSDPVMPFIQAFLTRDGGRWQVSITNMNTMAALKKPLLHCQESPNQFRHHHEPAHSLHKNTTRPINSNVLAWEKKIVCFEFLPHIPI